MAKPEIITVREALRRVNLEDLLAPGHSYENDLVGWTGTPRPFACGHTEVYGFGPLDRPDDNDEHGKGRRYRQPARVNQCFAGGEVLFSWQSYGRDSTGAPYARQGGVAVVIDTVPDRNSTCLRLAFTA